MDITKETYQASATLRAGGNVLEIDVADNPAEWAAWMVYYDCIQMDWSFGAMRGMWNRGSGKWGVPTTDPRHFDISFNPSEDEIRHYAKKESFGSQLSEEKRKEFATGILKEMHIGKKKATPQAHDQRGDDLAAFRELILEQKRNSPEYKAQQEAAEREAVKSIMDREGRKGN